MMKYECPIVALCSVVEVLEIEECSQGHGPDQMEI